MDSTQETELSCSGIPNYCYIDKGSIKRLKDCAGEVRADHLRRLILSAFIVVLDYCGGNIQGGEDRQLCQRGLFSCLMAGRCQGYLGNCAGGKDRAGNGLKMLCPG